MINKILLLFTVAILLGCKQKESTPTFYKANHKFFSYQGRTQILNGETVKLITSGSSVSINFSGNYCEVYLKGEYAPYNYVTIELDGIYLGRLKIESDSFMSYTIEVPSLNKLHTLNIFKTTEASSGSVLFEGVKVKELFANTKSKEKYIEFIGDSVTCGAAADTSENPCGSGEYIDQHNAYLSYGPRVARALNVDYVLSSVSGIGIYRNWNDENINEPIMSQVYENLYLNEDNTNPYGFSTKPDIVSICLGTNDLSDGDGIKTRLPFNKEKFMTNYIAFVNIVYSHYPDAKIVLLNSPMIVGDKNDILVSCLTEVQSHFKNKNKSIVLFKFRKSYNNGCTTHPSVEEHKEIADKLVPFLKDLLILK